MALKPELIQKIIFDLDDTLFDTNGQLVQTAAKEACQAMIDAGLKTTLDDCLEYRKSLLTNRGRGEIFEAIAKHFPVSSTAEVVAKAGFDQFHNREIKEKIFVFQGALNVLRTLQEKYELFLVTLGGIETQERKVVLLGLENYFERIYFVNISQRKTKTEAFKEIMSIFPSLDAQAFLSVGNRIDSEIRDAKSLGMQTALVAHGEYVNLKPQSPMEIPDHKIESLKDLLEVLT